MRRLALVAVGLALSGCPATHGEVKQAFQFRPGLAPSVYFPLAEGTAWSYDVADLVTGEKILLINRVSKQEGNRSEMFTGSDPLSYEDRGDMIVRLPSGATVLRTPIESAASWEIPGGRARITAVDATVAAVNASYPHCVVVEETTDDRRVVTSFAPGVGPVAVEIYARGPGGERLERRGVMRSFHEAGAPPL